MSSSYTPKGYAETDDFFAMVMVYAPEFPTNNLSLDEAFNKLSTGITTVASRTSNKLALELLDQVNAELSHIREQFSGNGSSNLEIRKAARTRLQHAYYDLYRKVGKLLKPSGDIGADDPV